jgi:hypothetical protein
MAGSVSNRCSIITLHTNQTTPPARKGEMVKRITNCSFSERKVPTFPFFKRMKTHISGAVETKVSEKQRWRSDVDEERKELY